MVVEVDEVVMYYAVSVRSPLVLSSLKKKEIGAIFIHENCQTLQRNVAFQLTRRVLDRG